MIKTKTQETKKSNNSLWVRNSLDIADENLSVSCMFQNGMMVSLPNYFICEMYNRIRRFYQDTSKYQIYFEQHIVILSWGNIHISLEGYNHNV